jgi:hypothetical protein
MGMGFEVVHSPQKPIWVPVDGTEVLMLGGLVSYGLRTPAQTGGCSILTAASGTADIGGGPRTPWGVVIGDNNATPVYATLATALVKVQTCTGVNSAAAQLARDWRLAESGMYSKGDPQPLVQVARITQETVLKGYLRGSATVGTTVITETTAASGLSTTGATFAATFGFTSTANFTTLAYTSGTNAGIYRIRTDGGTTITTNTRAFPYTPVVGDKAKSANLKQGIGQLKTDTTYGLWIDNATTAATNYWAVNILEINLCTEPGEEYVIFSFMGDQFSTANNARLTT